MFDNVCVAEQKGEEGKYVMTLMKGIPEFFIPRYLFRNGKDTVDMLDFIQWIEERVFPEERMDCKELLADLNLEEYRPFAIAKQTKACLMEDGWWVSFSDQDSFRKDTIRGAAGFPEWDKSKWNSNY